MLTATQYKDLKSADTNEKLYCSRNIQLGRSASFLYMLVVSILDHAKEILRTELPQYDVHANAKNNGDVIS